MPGRAWGGLALLALGVVGSACATILGLEDGTPLGARELTDAADDGTLDDQTPNGDSGALPDCDGGLVCPIAMFPADVLELQSEGPSVYARLASGTLMKVDAAAEGKPSLVHGSSATPVVAFRVFDSKVFVIEKSSADSARLLELPSSDCLAELDARFLAAEASVRVDESSVFVPYTRAGSQNLAAARVVPRIARSCADDAGTLRLDALANQTGVRDLFLASESDASILFAATFGPTSRVVLADPADGGAMSAVAFLNPTGASADRFAGLDQDRVYWHTTDDRLVRSARRFVGTCDDRDASCAETVLEGVKSAIVEDAQVVALEALPDGGTEVTVRATAADAGLVGDKRVAYAAGTARAHTSGDHHVFWAVGPMLFRGSTQ